MNKAYKRHIWLKEWEHLNWKPMFLTKLNVVVVRHSSLLKYYYIWFF